MQDKPAARQFAELAANELSGSLYLCSGNVKKKIIIRSGVPSFVESNLAAESLENFLVQRGELTESIAQKALSTAVSEERHVGEVLVQMGAVAPNDLFAALRRSVGKSILSVFAWETGTSSFEEGEVELDQALHIKVKPAPLILRGVCSFTPISVIQRDFTELLDRRHRLRPERKEDVGSLHLNTYESRVVNRLGMGRTLMQVSEEFDSDHEMVLRVLYALSLLEMTETLHPIATPPHQDPERDEAAAESPLEKAPIAVVKKTELVAVEVSKAGAGLPSEWDARATVPVINFASLKATAEAPPPPAVEEAAPSKNIPLSPEERNDIDAAFLTARSRDYLKLLQLAEGFSFAQLKSAFLTACHRFSPMSFVGREIGDQEERVEELFIILVQAFGALAVPATREKYLRFHNQKNAGNPIVEPEETPQNAYAVSVPDGASGEVKTGVTLMNMGEVKSAIECLGGATQSAPRDAYAHALLGYAIYLSDPVSRGKRAMDLLAKATALDPTLAYPFLLLGRVAEFQQDSTRALQAYADCLAIDPIEEEAEEALRRLKRFT